MNMFYKGFLALCLLSTVIGLNACKQEGPAEKAGQKVDQAIEQAGKTIDQAAEKAGKKMDQAGETLSDKSKKAGDYIDDTALTAKVKAEIASDPVLKVAQITVTTTKGVVQLSGVVDSRQSIDRALEIIRKIKGVEAVENHLVAKGTN